MFILHAEVGFDCCTHYTIDDAAIVVLTCLCLLLQHEMNCSTAAARHLASSGVDVYTAIAGAVGALYGPLHGGANEAVLRMLERIGKASIDWTLGVFFCQM